MHLLRIFLVIQFIGLSVLSESTLQAQEVSEKLLTIREIHFIGNRITKPSFILREMSVKAGDQIAATQLDNVIQSNTQRILNLQLFSQVIPKVDTIDAHTIDLQFEMNEILFWLPQPIFSLADRNFNVWWKEQFHQLDRTNIGLQLTRINFRGRSERIGGTMQLGYNKFFDLYYKIPFIDGKMKRGVGISATYSTGREINFQTNANKIDFYRNENYPYRFFQTELSYTFRPGYFVIHELNLSYNHYAITQEMYLQNPLYLGGKQKINYLELRFNVAFNNTDVRIYPLKGLEFKTVFTKRGLGIDKDVNQFSVRTEMAYYKKLSKQLSASVVFRGRISFPRHQPYLFERALGFRNEYVRGYEYYVVDGSHYAVVRANLRQRIIDRVIHQRVFPFFHYIPVRLYAKVFDDLGYAYHHQPGNSFLNNRIMHGYGFGIDLVISYYAKFRFEYSFNHLGQNGLFLHGNKE
jgi:outer membrane protein assembly factor BamA